MVKTLDAGSKIATRGQAWEVYRTQKLTNSFKFWS